MFCPVCGEKLQINAKYCHECGGKYSSTTSTSSKTGSKLSYADFKKKKEESRTTKFNVPTGKKKPKLDLDVTIHIGLMSTKDSDLKVKRGATLPLKVSPSIKVNELLEKAVEKQSVFNSEVPNRPTAYKILYPDKRPIDKIPGKDVDFVLKLYKEELGKPYCRITFYLVTQGDYFEYISSGLFTNDSTDDSTSDNTTCTSSASNTSNAAMSQTSPTTPHVSMSQLSSRPITSSLVHPTPLQSSPTAHYINDDQQPSTSGSVECPICLKLFSSSEVEEHAAECSAWLVENDQPHDLQDAKEKTSTPAECDPVELKRTLKEEIRKVIGAWPTIEMTRVSLRRKFLWTDFKAALERKIRPTSVLKVVFVGEPCVDDGGPKRELFTGEHCYNSNNNT